MENLSREGAFNHDPEQHDRSSRLLVRYSWIFSTVALALVLIGLYGLER